MDLQLGMTVHEAAKASRIGRNRLYTAVKNGELRAIRVGRRWIIPTDALREWMDSQARQGHDPRPAA